MTSDDWHVSSLVVHSRPERQEEVKAAVGAIPGVEIHGTDDQHGKLVVTAEGRSEAAIVDCIDHINRIDGILSAVLVYHHSEDAVSLEEEVDGETDAP